MRQLQAVFVLGTGYAIAKPAPEVTFQTRAKEGSLRLRGFGFRILYFALFETASLFYICDSYKLFLF